MLLKALAKNAEDRYPNCVAFAEALEQAVRERDTAAPDGDTFSPAGKDTRRSTGTRRNPDPQPLRSPPPEPDSLAGTEEVPSLPTAARPKKRTLRYAAVAAAVLVLAGLAAAAVALVWPPARPVAVVIESIPAGARVIDLSTNQESAVRTPGPFEFDPKTGPRKVRLELEGYAPAELEIDPARQSRYAVPLKALPALPPPITQVTVDTTPPGARLVWLDTGEIARCPGPFALAAARGARLEADGFKPLAVTIDPAKGSRQSYQLEPVVGTPPAPVLVAIRIDSRPEKGCEVLVDGALKGRTPLDLQLLPRTYAIGVVPKGGQPVVKEIAVRETGSKGPQEFVWDGIGSPPKLDARVAADLKACEEALLKTGALVEFLKKAEADGKVPRWQAGLEANDPAAHVLVGLCRAEEVGLPKSDAEAVAHFSRAEQARLPSGAYWLGRMHAAGRGGLVEDKAKAVALYTKAVDAGHPLAATSLGLLFLSGWPDQAPDPVAAAKWFKKAADGNDGVGIFQLALLHQKGTGVPPDERTAAALYKRAATEFAYPPAMNQLALMYLFGWPDQPPDRVAAADWFKAAADAGNVYGLHNLACFTRDGVGVPRDLEKAAALYKRAATEFKYPPAMNDLGVIYQSGGKGVEANDAESEKWFRAAAELENQEAMVNLGQLLEQRGTAREHAEGAAWYQLAGKHPRALNNLAKMYEEGRGGLKANPDRAFALFQAAAGAGNPMAMFNLGLIADKKGNTKEADKWYAKAVEVLRAEAEAGDAAAMFNLGLIFEKKGNTKEADRWYRFAAREGHAGAIKKLKRPEQP